jgi:hypothetical protein
MTQWLKFDSNGSVQPVDTFQMEAAKIDSQLPSGDVSISEQNSGWIAKTADGRMYDEAHHEWGFVPKDRIIDIRLILSNSNVAIPKLDMFTRFVYFRRGDGKYIGVGAELQNGLIVYLLTLNIREGNVFSLDYIYDIRQLPMVDRIEFVTKESIKDDQISIDLPSKMIVIPRRDSNNYFFQYKDGAIRTGRPASLFGQVIGMTTNHIGNCLVLYYDQPTNRCLVSIDNIFNMRVSLVAQGFPEGIFLNPLTGEKV